MNIINGIPLIAQLYPSDFQFVFWPSKAQAHDLVFHAAHPGSVATDQHAVSSKMADHFPTHHQGVVSC